MHHLTKTVNETASFDAWMIKQKHHLVAHTANSANINPRSTSGSREKEMTIIPSQNASSALFSHVTLKEPYTVTLTISTSFSTFSSLSSAIVSFYVLQWCRQRYPVFSTHATDAQHSHMEILSAQTGTACVRERQSLICTHTTYSGDGSVVRGGHTHQSEPVLSHLHTHSAPSISLIDGLFRLCFTLIHACTHTLHSPPQMPHTAQYPALSSILRHTHRHSSSHNIFFSSQDMVFIALSLSFACIVSVCAHTIFPHVAAQLSAQSNLCGGDTHTRMGASSDANSAHTHSTHTSELFLISLTHAQTDPHTCTHQPHTHTLIPQRETHTVVAVQHTMHISSVIHATHLSVLHYKHLLHVLLTHAFVQDFCICTFTWAAETYHGDISHTTFTPHIGKASNSISTHTHTQREREREQRRKKENNKKR